MRYQIRCLEYTDPWMQRDMRRMLRKVPGSRPWMGVMATAARVLGFGAAAIFIGMAVIVALSEVIEPGNMGEDGWIPLLLAGLGVVYLLLALMLRPIPNPVRDGLWPPETSAVAITCEETALRIEDGRMTIQIPYREIQRVEETESCFYLFPMRSHFLMLRKRDFVQGDPAGFAAFLAGRMSTSSAPCIGGGLP